MKKDDEKNFGEFVSGLIRTSGLERKIIEHFNGRTNLCGAAFANLAAHFLALGLEPFGDKKIEREMALEIVNQALRIKNTDSK